MLLTTSNNRLWRFVGIILAIPLVLSYIWYARQMTPHGGTAFGLAYGIAGLLLILFLLFQAVRKRWHRCVFGKNEAWVNAHIYAGLLAMVLIFMHAGFQFREMGATVAAGLLSVVVVSGIIGSILYTVIPRHLHEVKGNLPAQEVSDQMNKLAGNIDEMSQNKSDSFRLACQCFLEMETPRRLLGFTLTFGKIKSQQENFSRRQEDKMHGIPLGKTQGQQGKINRRLEDIIQAIPASEQAQLQQVLSFRKQLRELHTQFRRQMKLKNILESWLYLHVPFSVAMVLAIMIHLLIVAYY